jgi:thiol-disulfide isomerase/thioredoxin
MTRAKLGILLGAIVLAAGVLAIAIGFIPAGRQAQAPIPRALSPQEQRQAEERLLDEKSFSHPVDALAPDVNVVTDDGKRVKLAGERGKVVFVNFWATWCPPCIEEMPSMLRLGADLAASHPGRFEMVAVSGDDSWEAIQQYFGKNFGGVPKGLKVVRDPDASAARAFYCAARGYCPDIKFPESYIVDRSGRIVAMIVGPRDWSHPDARQLLDLLLRG